jgi:hypothetical protein
MAHFTSRCGQFVTVAIASRGEEARTLILEAIASYWHIEDSDFAWIP